MDRLADTILENLDIASLNPEECQDSLYYLAALLEVEDNPEHFVKFQWLKLKVEARLTKLKQQSKDVLET